MALNTTQLRGKRIAVLAADGFEYIELSVPKKALRLAGATVEIVSLHRGKIRGMNLTEPTRTVGVDKAFEEANPEDYDAALIPGGFVGPDFLRQSRLARDFVRAMDAAQKPIATLCHGPWLLVSAELVQQRQLAAWPSLRDDIVHAGGVWLDQPLVWDRNWVSSRGPQDLPQFVPGMLELFARGAAAPELTTSIQPNPDGTKSSPKPEQPIDLALTAARLLPGPTLRSVRNGGAGYCGRSRHRASARILSLRGALERHTRRLCASSAALSAVIASGEWSLNFSLHGFP